MHDKIALRPFEGRISAAVRALVLRLAAGGNLVALLRRDDERVIIAGLDAVVDLDVPVLERGARGLYLPFDALLDG